MSIESSQNRHSIDSIFIFVSFAAVCIIQTGCLPFENRWRRSSPVDSSQEDDWAPPKLNSHSSGYRNPQQFRTTASRKTPRDRPDSDAKIPQLNADPIPAAYKPPTAAETPKVAQAVSSNENDKAPGRAPETSQNDPEVALNIVETEPKDLDLTGAIAALPPNLQVVLKRQLDALEKREKETYALTGATSTNSSEVEKKAVEKKISMRFSDSGKATGNDKTSTVATKATVTEATVTEEQVIASPVQLANATTVGDTTTVSNEVITASATTMTAPKAESEPPIPAKWNEDLSESIAKLEKSIKENPSPQETARVNQEMTLRLLYLANRQLEEAMRPIEGLTEPERDYVQHQVQALYEASNPDPIPVKNRQWSLVMNSQREATNQLAAISNLEVKSVSFCTDVQGYGVVTKFPSNTFKPDQDLLLYCELDNVAADDVKEGFETQLQGSYEIIDPNGRRIADQLLPMEKEICKNHRRDYFIVYRIYTPMQIGPGNYQLRLTVEDMKARKFGQATLDFQIQK